MCKHGWWNYEKIDLNMSPLDIFFLKCCNWRPRKGNQRLTLTQWKAIISGLFYEAESAAMPTLQVKRINCAFIFADSLHKKKGQVIKGQVIRVFLHKCTVPLCYSEGISSSVNTIRCWSHWQFNPTFAQAAAKLKVLDHTSISANISSSSVHNNLLLIWIYLNYLNPVSIS